jgi:hypothetical protein
MAAGLRMRPFRVGQAIVGIVLVVIAGAGLWVLLDNAAERREVLALTRPVAAGTQLADGDVRVVSIATDDGVTATPATRRDDVVGSYARYDLAEGALVAPDNLQQHPLVAPDRVLMSVVVPAANVPAALAVDDEISVVVTRSDGPCPRSETVRATVRAITGEPAVAGASATPVALSVEVPPTAVGLLGLTEPDSIAVVREVSPVGSDASAGCDGAPSERVATTVP